MLSAKYVYEAAIPTEVEVPLDNFITTTNSAVWAVTKQNNNPGATH
jgi:hypothetical protein